MAEHFSILACEIPCTEEPGGSLWCHKRVRRYLVTKQQQQRSLLRPKNSKILWREEPGGLQPMGSQRVRHDWVTKHSTKILNWFLKASLCLWRCIILVVIVILNDISVSFKTSFFFFFWKGISLRREEYLLTVSVVISLSFTPSLNHLWSKYWGLTIYQSSLLWVLENQQWYCINNEFIVSLFPKGKEGCHGACLC